MSDLVTSNVLKENLINECIQQKWLAEYFIRFGKGVLSISVFENDFINLCADMRTAIVQNYIKEKGYLDNLFLRYNQLLYKDFYGDNVTKDWDIEVKKFTENRMDNIHEYLYLKTPEVFIEELKKYDLVGFYCEPSLDSIVRSIKYVVEFNIDNNEYISNNNLDNEKMITPYDYEEIITNIFSNLGWDTFTTSKSGDQGADIIMQKYGLKYVVQCKLYNQPVGNKAVQEVTSAQAYYNAIGSIVVTNNDYTKSARQLAESQNVWLLHDSQLEEWNILIDKMIASLNENVDE